MCTEFVDSLREMMLKGGFISKDKDGREQGGCFLVGFKNRLFSIGIDFQVEEFEDEFYSVGSGQEYALGAIKALLINGKKLEAETIVETALSAAAHYSTGVEPPFVILSTDATNGIVG